MLTNEEIRLELPQLQLSTEQMIIKELHEQVIALKVENLKLDESTRGL